MNDNPFAPPSATQTLHLSPTEQARQRLARPATALIIISSIHAVFLSIPLVSYVIFVFQGISLKDYMIVPGNLVLHFAAMIFISIGAAKMGFLESYRLGRFAAFLSCIPVLSPMYVLGIPFGIWALYLLSKPEIKAAFEPQTVESVTRNGK